jgi:fibronectin-binding autotransporter adhesin
MKEKNMNVKKACVLVSGIALVMARTTLAESGTWTNDASGNWSDAANWSSNPTVPGTAAGDVVGLAHNITAARTNTIDTTSRTVGTLNIGDPTTAFFPYTLNASGGATLTFDNNGSGAALNKTSTATANDLISSPIILNDNLTITMAQPLTISGAISEAGGARSLAKSGNGVLNLSGNNSYSGGTTVNGGTIKDIRATSFGTGPITIAGNSTLESGYGVHPVLANSIAVNNSVTATIYLATFYYTIAFDGVLSGDGTVNLTGQGATFKNAENTFAGTLIASSSTLTLNSLPDSANPIQLNNGTIAMGTGTAAPMVFSSRRIELTGTTSGGTIANNNATATNTITINTNLRIVGTGAKTLTLGGSNTGANTFAGAITNGVGSVISLTKSGAGTWALSGTNTYSGKTFNNSSGGTLVFQDVERSLPSGSALTTAINNNQTQVTKLLSDSSGVITLGNTVKADGGGSSGTGTMTIFVGNNGTANGGNGAGGTTNSTVVLGTLDLRSSSDNGLVDRRMATEVGFTGADGYNVQINGVTLAARGDTTAKGAFLKPTSATVTITGTVQQNNGRTASDTAGIQNLTLAGTGTGHAISGTIRNAADFDDGSNSNALPLSLVKTNSSTWTLSGANTFSGTTTVSGGTLVLAASTCLSDTNLLSIASGAKVQLNDGVKEVVGLLKTNGVAVANGTYGSTSSAAATKTDTFFSGTGVLYVGMPVPPSGTLIILH